MSSRPWQSDITRDHQGRPAWVANAHDRARELLRQDRALRGERRATKARVDVEIEVRGAATAGSRIRDILFRDRELIAELRPATSSDIPTPQPARIPSQPRDALYADARARLTALKMRLAAAKARAGLSKVKAESATLELGRPELAALVESVHG